MDEENKQRRITDSQYEALVIATVTLEKATVAFNYHQKICEEREHNKQRFFDEASKRFSRIEKLLFGTASGIIYVVMDLLNVIPT